MKDDIFEIKNYNLLLNLHFSEYKSLFSDNLAFSIKN